MLQKRGTAIETLFFCAPRRYLKDEQTTGWIQFVSALWRGQSFATLRREALQSSDSVFPGGKGLMETRNNKLIPLFCRLFVLPFLKKRTFVRCRTQHRRITS